MTNSSTFKGPKDWTYESELRDIFVGHLRIFPLKSVLGLPQARGGR